MLEIASRLGITYRRAASSSENSNAGATAIPYLQQLVQQGNLVPRYIPSNGVNVYTLYVPSTDPSAPVLIYVPGGPGSSYVDDILGTHLPVVYDPIADRWVQNATKQDLVSTYNILYADYPGATGYSIDTRPNPIYSDSDTINTVGPVFEQMIAQYGLQGRELHFYGASYAGKYIPLLARRLKDKGYPVTAMTCLVPATDRHLDFKYMDLYWRAQSANNFTSSELFSSIPGTGVPFPTLSKVQVTDTVPFDGTINMTFSGIVSQLLEAVYYLTRNDAAGLRGTGSVPAAVYQQASSLGSQALQLLYVSTFLNLYWTTHSLFQFLDPSFRNADKWRAFLNRSDVKQILGAQTEWLPADIRVGRNYRDRSAPVTAVLKSLVEEGVYTQWFWGQLDGIVPPTAIAEMVTNIHGTAINERYWVVKDSAVNPITGEFIFGGPPNNTLGKLYTTSSTPNAIYGTLRDHPHYRGVTPISKIQFQLLIQSMRQKSLINPTFPVTGNIDINI